MIETKDYQIVRGMTIDILSDFKGRDIKPANLYSLLRKRINFEELRYDMIDSSSFIALYPDGRVKPIRDRNFWKSALDKEKLAEGELPIGGLDQKYFLNSEPFFKIDYSYGMDNGFAYEPKGVTGQILEALVGDQDVINSAHKNQADTLRELKINGNGLLWRFHFGKAPNVPVVRNFYALGANGFFGFCADVPFGLQEGNLVSFK